jgi:peptidyl-prolyl cis-trans isomerase B (cyclophilin B)
MTKQLLFLTFLFLCLLTSCGQGNKKDYIVTIKTSYGDMVAILYDETPKHKENFIKLAKEKYFDSLLFHRVMQGFMIQGGDPDSKKAQPGQHLGIGGPGYTIPAEFNPALFHMKGALSAARIPSGQNPTKASSGSQFYVVQGTVVDKADADNLKIDNEKLNLGFQMIAGNPANKPLMDSLMLIYSSGDMKAYQKKILSLVPRIEKQTNTKVTKEVSPEKIEAYTTVGGSPHLDGDYTVFGKVIKGLEVIDKIAALRVDGNNRPMEDVRMTVTVEEMSRKKITKEFGYQFPEIKK